MPEQLDLFTTNTEQETDPVKKASALLLERRLKPPSVIMQNQGPEIVMPRFKEKTESKHIKPENVTTETEQSIEITEIPASTPAEEPGYLKEDADTGIVSITAAEIPAPIAIIAVKPLLDEKSKTTRGRKSIKEMSMEADLPEVPEDEKLFSKQYYGIGEVAVMFHVNTSLLRYWESEFDILKPKKNGKGDRFFRPDDIKNLQIIHHLLRQRKFTIEGAKDYLKSNKQSKEKFEMIKQLQQLKAFLLEMKAGL